MTPGERTYPPISPADIFYFPENGGIRMCVIVSLAGWLKKIDEGLTRIEEAVVAALLFLMSCVIFLSVMERFLLQLGITWAEELARYLSVWGAFIGAALAAKKGAHIGIEAFVQLLPPKARRFEEMIVSALCLVFSLAVLFTGAKFLNKLAATNQLSAAMRINMVWAYGAVPTGCALMSVHYFIKVVTGISDLFFETPGGESE
jgi:C4-dicarboxylate transporter DctQ subunit